MRFLIALVLSLLLAPTGQAQRPLSEAEIRQCCFLFRIGRRDFDRYRDNPMVQQLLQQVISQNQRLMELLARIDKQPAPAAPIYSSPLMYPQPIIIGFNPGSPQQRLPWTAPQQQLPQSPPQQRLPQSPPQQALPQQPPQQRLPMAPPQQALPLGGNAPPASYQEFSGIRRAVYPLKGK